MYKQNKLYHPGRYVFTKKNTQYERFTRTANLIYYKLLPIAGLVFIADILARVNGF